MTSRSLYLVLLIHPSTLARSVSGNHLFIMTYTLEKLVNAFPWLLGQELGWNDGPFLRTKIVGSGNIWRDTDLFISEIDKD